MSHREQQDYITSIKERFPQYFQDVKVLEIGSLNINGTLRDYFTNCDYTGVDLEPGPGVDVISPGQDLDYPDRSFDITISAECFEHNPYWVQTFINMQRMSKGLVAFTCAGEGRPEHGTSRQDPWCSPFTVGKWDYYKNLTVEDFTSVMPLKEMFREHEFTVNDVAHDLYFWGLTHE